MNWEALGAIGEIVGAIAVVLTLIYLSTQIRQSTRQQRAESQRAVGEEFNRLMQVLYDVEKAGMIFRAYSNWAESTAQEQMTLSIHLVEFSNHLQTILSLWQNGGLEESAYISQEENFLSMLSTNGGKEWWSIWSNLIGGDFSARINEKLATRTYPGITEIIPWANVKHWK